MTAITKEWILEILGSIKDNATPEERNYWEFMERYGAYFGKPEDWLRENLPESVFKLPNGAIVGRDGMIRLCRKQMWDESTKNLPK